MRSGFIAIETDPAAAEPVPTSAAAKGRVQCRRAAVSTETRRRCVRPSTSRKRPAPRRDQHASSVSPEPGGPDWRRTEPPRPTRLDACPYGQRPAVSFVGFPDGRRAGLFLSRHPTIFPKRHLRLWPESHCVKESRHVPPRPPWPRFRTASWCFALRVRTAALRTPLHPRPVVPGRPAPYGNPLRGAHVPPPTASRSNSGLPPCYAYHGRGESSPTPTLLISPLHPRRLPPRRRPSSRTRPSSACPLHWGAPGTRKVSSSTPGLFAMGRHGLLSTGARRHPLGLLLRGSDEYFREGHSKSRTVLFSRDDGDVLPSARVWPAGIRPVPDTSGH